MAYRVGVFLIVVGVLGFILFAVLWQADEPNLLICSGSILCIAFGIWLMVLNAPASDASKRFSTINKFRRRNPDQNKQ
jgi:hypothetical protein